jgi:succinate-semialdehyde dehydrogenase / glutarate-semialdehyde dehydrogenase
MAIADISAQKTDDSTRKTIDVLNPISMKSIGTIPVNTAEEVQKAVERARVAQIAWDALGVKGRNKLLSAWRELMWEKRQEIIEVIRNESGKVEGGAFTEVLVVDNICQYYYANAEKILKPQSRQPLFPVAQRAKVHYKPYGVVGIVSPWNYPFILPFVDSLPALYAGNAVIIKPSEVTPYSVEIGVRFMHEVGIPKDVIQFVHGDGSTGKALIDHVDYVAFTGSTATGRKVAMQAASRLIPYSLELGGKDASIVMSDVDLDMAATGVIKGAFENAGQACVSIERVYVDEKIYEPFLAKVLDYAKTINVGGGAGMDVHMGTMINEPELKRTEEHIQDAVAKGAKVVFGGKRRPDLGPRFHEPTILVDVDHTMEVMREETFGPLLPIMKVKNMDEAVRLSNDSRYGLSASIFSRNLREAEELAEKINSGDVSINRAQIAMGTPGATMGGTGESGLGRRNGPEGLLKYTKQQSIITDTNLGQKPAITHFDEFTLNVYYVLRRVRKALPFF